VRSNTLIKIEGMQALAERLGLVDAERFMVLLRREPFDYTQWRSTLYEGVSLEVFLEKADAFRKAHSEK